MKQYEINGRIAGYSVTEDPTGIFTAISSFLARVSTEQGQIASNNARNRKMKNQLARDAIDNLPLELKYRLCGPRS
jgi:hypothetical protein